MHILIDSNGETYLKIIIAITGASGIIYGVRLLKVLKDRPEIETFLIISRGAKKVIEAETDFNLQDIINLADRYYEEDDFSAPIASSSYIVDGMVIIPTSMKTLAALAHGYSDNLITRAADNVLRYKKPLILVPRETPLSPIHLENMLKLSINGALILPACPAFYIKPTNIDDLVNFIVGKVLDALGIENTLYSRWGGKNEKI